MEDLFRGELVHLVAEDPETIAESFSRWSNDSEYTRLLFSGVTYPRSKKSVKEWIEKQREKNPPEFLLFMIRRLEDDRLIGEIGLDGIKWNHGTCFVGISIGEREMWGKGYGTDAMRIILRFAFTELNLHRISLDVFEYNPRAIRSYEKAGFVSEGRVRSVLNKEGKRWDFLFMGILKDEWAALYKPDLEEGLVK